MLMKTVERIKTWGIFGTIIGVGMVVIGVAGLFFPVVPGVVFIFFGLLILGVETAIIIKIKDKLFGKRKK